MKPETQDWLRIVDHDLAAAQVLLDRDLFPGAIFWSQQAVEKCLKALWVEEHEVGTPPRVHDLPEILLELSFTLPEWREFLIRLSRLAVASRYEPPSQFPQGLAVECVDGAKNLCALLRQKLA